MPTVDDASLDDETSNAEGWRHFPHQADIGVEGWGPNPARAFAQAGLALTAVITPPGNVHGWETVALHCRAPDLELLLVEWLNALIYAMAVRHMLFSRYEVSISGDRLEATVWGEPIEPARHQPAVEVKGATYTALEVRQGQDGRWHARCVVDV